MALKGLKSLLIANRGEIAVRVIRAAKELGIRTVAVYSTADRDSLHVRLADEAVCIGPAKASKSYLYKSGIITVALLKECDAVHPGYGFLAENWRFAASLESYGIGFIGPSSEVIRLMGDKVQAKLAAKEAGVKLLPSSPPLEDEVEAMRWAERIGYPVMLKAAGGGGGRGMRVVESPDELRLRFHEAKAEAKAAFSDPRIFIEPYIRRAKHVEVQVMGDRYGNVIHVFDRECSLQRKYQKVLEEAPSNLPDELRAEIREAAVRLAKHIGYYNAGTVEFLYDLDRDEFYFMEMNTRIQVEHPVSEMISGFDLVKWQLGVAGGWELPRQEELSLRGHAIEVRINAEDPTNRFRPSTGLITGLRIPGGFGVRVDTHIYPGFEITPYYDNMLMKLIVWAPTRREAIDKLRVALDELLIEGVKTNVDFLRRLIRSEEFVNGSYTTRTLGEKLAEFAEAKT